MRQSWPLLRALSGVIVFVAILGFVLQVAELWLTRQGVIVAAYGYVDVDMAEGFVLMSAFIGLAINLVWNLGWAAVDHAAVLYVDGKA